MFNFHTFDNGIRIIHHQVPSRVAHCGLYINAGSRHEKPGEHGMAHFVEHLVFKGTATRKAHHIINRLESVGGEINAYTSKEETCIYCSFLKEDFERSLELLTDMAFRSVFPEREIEREKLVVIDEIISYRDNPSELIFDDFEELVFDGDPIGRNILGSPRSLKKFGRKDILGFISENYSTDRMVFSSVGNMDFRQVLKLAGKHLASQPANLSALKSNGTINYIPADKTVKKRTHQTHCILGNRSFNIHDRRRISMGLLNNILGGPGMSARLNLALREKTGYAYNVESNFTSYSDTGIFSVYFGTDREHLEKCHSLIHKEFERLRNEKLSTLQLKRAKRQLAGQLTIGWENKESLMLTLGKSMLFFNRADNLEDIYRKIDSITSEELLEVANIVLDPGSLSKLTYV